MKKILGNIIAAIISLILLAFCGMLTDGLGFEFESIFGVICIGFIILPGYYYSKKIIMKLLLVIKIKEFNNGDKYEGEMKDAKMHGKGKYTFLNGEIYNGEFKNDLFHGKGIYSWPDGKVEEGLWENDDFIKKTN